MKISAARPVSIPARNIGNNPLIKAMDDLEIGSGIDYVIAGKDKDGNDQLPQLKNQYSHVNHKRWDEAKKTFKVFKSDDQSGLGGFETRFTIARAPYEAKVAKAPAAPAAPAAGQEAGQVGEGQAGNEDLSNEHAE